MPLLWPIKSADGKSMISEVPIEEQHERHYFGPGRESELRNLGTGCGGVEA